MICPQAMDGRWPAVSSPPTAGFCSTESRWEAYCAVQRSAVQCRRAARGSNHAGAAVGHGAGHPAGTALRITHCVRVSHTALHTATDQKWPKVDQKTTKKVPKVAQKWPEMTNLHQQWKLFCHNVLQPKSSLPQLLHTYKCRMTTPALHTVIHCTLHCTLHCLLHCSLHCTLHYTLHCTLHAALIQCATAAREQYFPVLSKGRSPEDETLYCTVCSAQCIGHWTALCTAHCTGHCTAALDTYLGTALDTGLDTALDNALHAALLHCCTALHFCTDTALDWTHLTPPSPR
jgi:hypothetical protein